MSSSDYDPKKNVRFFEANPFPKENFCFGVSEMYTENIAATHTAVQEFLRRHGLKFAVDDIGNNFGGLKLLYHGRPDFVKVHRHFTSDLLKDPRKKLFISNILNICRSLGCIIVAKSIETEEEYFTCKELGFDLIQGNLISEPKLDISGFETSYPLVYELSSRNKRRKIHDDRDYVQSEMVYIEPIHCQANIMDVFETIKNVNQNEVLPVIGSKFEPLGTIHEDIFKPFAFSHFGKELLQNPYYFDKGINHFMKKCPIADIHTPLVQLLDMFVQYEDVEGIMITRNTQYAGFLSAKSLLRALNEKQLSIARDQNPLTRLPGNTIIHEFISNALRMTNTKFILVYYDFNNFKPYNDTYGFREGDRTLLLFSDILKKYQEKYGYFAGHVGGDDFFLGVKEESLSEAIGNIKQLAEKFNQDVKSFYTQEDREKGHIEARDRKGVERTFPLLAVSAAIVELKDNRSQMLSTGKLSRIIGDLKKKAKSSEDGVAITTL
jgi:diguanylate cyclase (GGDEF)-like protein